MHYVDYLQEAVITGEDIRVVANGVEHVLLYQLYSEATEERPEGWYVVIDGQWVPIDFDINPGCVNRTPYILTSTSLQLLSEYALEKAVRRDAYILAPAFHALKKEFGAKLVWMVAKDYRLIEKDRSTLFLRFSGTSNGEGAETRYMGFMADSAYDGYRIDKHSVSGWRLREMAMDEPLMQIVDEAIKTHG